MGRLVLSYWLLRACVCARVRVCAGGTGCLAVRGGRGADRAVAEEEEKEAQREKEQQCGSPNTVAERPGDETRGRILQYLIMSVGGIQSCLFSL